MWRAVAVHGNTAYFSEKFNVYSYTLSHDKWTKLKQCNYKDFSMTVINNQLTTIGGMRDSPPSSVQALYLNYVAVNTLLCLSMSSSEMKWEELLPPMPTHRIFPAVVTTSTHLIAAGGKTRTIHNALSVVETLDTNTLHWTSVRSIPKAMGSPDMTLCKGQLVRTQQDLHVLCGRTPQVP